MLQKTNELEVPQLATNSHRVQRHSVGVYRTSHNWRDHSSSCLHEMCIIHILLQAECTQQLTEEIIPWRETTSLTSRRKVHENAEGGWPWMLQFRSITCIFPLKLLAPPPQLSGHILALASKEPSKWVVRAMSTEAGTLARIQWCLLQRYMTKSASWMLVFFEWWPS